LHGGSLEELCAMPWMRRVARTVFSMPDALVLLANSERREFNELGVSAPLSIIRNGIDVTQYSGPHERTHSGRIRRMAFMGRLIRPKGIFEAMEAVRILRAEESFRDVELRIAGSGPAKEEIESWIRAHGMEQCIKAAGSIHGRDKIEFLREADVFVFPTYREGLPYAVLESLAAGTPVIASKVAGIPDVVADRVHGILIDAKDPRQIVDAVHELSRSEADLRAMSRNCTIWAKQELGLERLATQFGDLYEKVTIAARPVSRT
jgi:glycosyltransferase involved in cell wall biosynthesis